MFNSSEIRTLMNLPPAYFRRADETPDSLFYQAPRLVTHIDATTIAALRQFYREQLPSAGDLLDLMSSWISHLPEEVEYGRVAGLGMNREELAANPRLTDFVVHDLNADPQLPYPAASFDAVLIAVSVQYLIRPVEVFASIAGVLRPGGRCIVAMSHRLFPTKAIAAFCQLGPRERHNLVQAYFVSAGGFETPDFFDASPPTGDPLWIVTAQRAG
ncbi:MAG: methyltransferase domain-containing protein [Candidatus Latescibacteria bacterium]|nr:methyltransferase domain-containing protein [Candidatus Latescibacterota bacterium]